MGSFYGNISNVSKTQMKFDLIYPNRKAMDKDVATDGVAIGRYVLVQYGEKAYSTRFFLGSDKSLYLTVPSEGIHAQVGKDIEQNEIIHILPDYELDDKLIKHNYSSFKSGLYKCVNSSGNAQVEPVDLKNADNLSLYTINYMEDKNQYGGERGYDATVWVKTLKDGNFTYQMVADLNVTLPTFGITVNPPTREMSAPHFGSTKEDTNIFYNLNVQPNWGFRVKEAEDENLSDETTTHLVYSEAEGWAENTVNAQIYYNKDGFNKDIESKSTAENEINITYTGESGYIYSDGQSHPDTGELSIYLPALGNAICDVWNMIYGTGVLDNNNKRKTNIQYKGVQLKDDKDNTTYNLNTLAGCINAAQEIIGLIKEKPADMEANADMYAENLIYRDGNKYYCIYREPVVDVDGNVSYTYKFIDVSLNDSISNLYSAIAQISRILGPDDENNTDSTTLRGALNTVYAKMESWKEQLAKAAGHAFGKITDATGNLALAVAETVTNNDGSVTTDTLRIATDDYLEISQFTNGSYRGIKLSAKVDNNLIKDSQKLITGGAVYDALGDIHSILEAINGATLEPMINYADIAIDTKEKLWDDE